MAGLIARAVRVLQDGVAVGRRFRDRVGRDVAAGAWTVLDDHRLAEGFAELGAEHAGKHVDRAAGDEGDDDADRLMGIGLGSGAARVAA